MNSIVFYDKTNAHFLKSKIMCRITYYTSFIFEIFCYFFIRYASFFYFYPFPNVKIKNKQEIFWQLSQLSGSGLLLSFCPFAGASPEAKRAVKSLAERRKNEKCSDNQGF